MSWPENPQLDEERYDIPLLANLDAIKNAIGTPATVSGLSATMAGQGATVAGHTAAIATITANIATNTSGIAGHETRLGVSEKKQTSQGLGLVAPNPGGLRLFPVLGAMPDPPDIVTGTGGASSVISDSVHVLPASGAFVYTGCKADVVGASFPDDTRYSPLHAQIAGDINVVGPWTVDFEWYGSEFELELKGSSAAIYRLIVDELGYDVREGRSDLANDGNTYLIHYHFGSAAFRRIHFDFGGSTRFGGIHMEPNSTIWPSSKAMGPKVIVTGDSFAEGSFTYWPSMMGELLGWRDLTVVGKGSTGYLDTADGGDTYRNRAQKDIYDHNPDIVVVSGGLNDNGTSYTSILAEANTFFAEIRGELPSAILIVSGVQYVFGAADGNIVHVRDAVRAAAATYAHCYIEQIGGPYPYSGIDSDYTGTGWMTGLGRDGSPTGDGNSDIFRSSDGTHPTQLGHDYRGWRHAQAIAGAMPILGAS